MCKSKLLVVAVFATFMLAGCRGSAGADDAPAEEANAGEAAEAADPAAPTPGEAAEAVPAPDSPAPDDSVGAPDDPISPPITGPEVETPSMPEDWIVTADFMVTPEDLARFSSFLGVEVIATRNTVFKIGEGTVQVNSVLTNSEADAAAAVAVMHANYPAARVLQRGPMFYEFDCADEMRPTAAVGRAHLDQ